MSPMVVTPLNKPLTLGRCHGTGHSEKQNLEWERSTVTNADSRPSSFDEDSIHHPRLDRLQGAFDTKRARKASRLRGIVRRGVDWSGRHLPIDLVGEEGSEKMASAAYGQIARPAAAVMGLGLTGILPLEKNLKDSTAVRVLHLSSSSSADDEKAEKGAIFVPRFPRLVSRMHALFNDEIEDGNTYPQEDPLDEDQFRAYFLSYDAFVVLQVTTSGKGVDLDDLTADWEAELLGFFYVKPNFPGRCSHICNGGFFTAPLARNRGVGRCMAEAFLEVVPALGYKASMFNLVFTNNAASVKLWTRLGFREIGRIPKAGRLRSAPDLVDAIMFYYDFTEGLEAS